MNALFLSRVRFSVGILHKLAQRLLPALSLTLAGCASQALDRAPDNAVQPWQPSTEVGASERMPSLTAAKNSEPSYAVPKVPLPTAWQPEDTTTTLIDPTQSYDLLGLIDLAQRQNPHTRMAWNRAREAALAVGMAEATFLPILSANVVGGVQRVSTPAPLAGLIGPDRLSATARGAIPFLSLSWLLFDFGGRAAVVEAAEQASFAANVLFNASHQKLIRDVTDFYYQYDAARQNLLLQEQALQHQQEILQAAEARWQAELGTKIELALAKQGVAQAKLHLVNAQGMVRNTYLSLLSALGLPATTRLQVADAPPVPLPAPAEALTEQRIHEALSGRADLVAAYAAVKAADAGVQAAEAQFYPKVYLGAAMGKHHSRFSTSSLPLPELQHQSAATGVMIGVHLPLFDGGLRRAAVQQAELKRTQSQDTLQQLHYDALREVVAAETVLNSALEAYQAASELVVTADTAYQGAYEAFKQGVGTITVVHETANGVLVAQRAQSDSYHAARVAAANLAFVMGDMTRAQTNWLPN